MFGIGFRMVGFRVYDLRFIFLGYGFRVWGSELRDQGLGLRV